MLSIIRRIETEQTLKYTISFFLIICFFIGIAQEQKPFDKDSIQHEIVDVVEDEVDDVARDAVVERAVQDSVSKKRFKLMSKLDSFRLTFFDSIDHNSLSRVRIGADLFGFGKLVAQGNGSYRYSFALDSDLRKRLINLDFGFEGFNSNLNSNVLMDSYKSEGGYFKMGFDKKFSRNNPYKSQFFAGVRYCRAFFKDDVTVYQESSEMRIFRGNFQNINVQGRWFELDWGLKVAMSKNTFIGYTFRLMMVKKIKGQDSFDSYYMPGWGLAQKDVNLRFNFYLMKNITWNGKAREGKEKN